MTIADLKHRYPKFNPAESDRNGYLHQAFYVSGNDLSEMSEADKEGLLEVVFSFLDRKLIDLELTYNGFTDFLTFDAFNEAIANKLKLPHGAAWRQTDKMSRQLTCDGFTAVVKFGPKQGRYEVETQALKIIDDQGAQLLKERLLNGPEERRKAFKP